MRENLRKEKHELKEECLTGNSEYVLNVFVDFSKANNWNYLLGLEDGLEYADFKPYSVYDAIITDNYRLILQTNKDRFVLVVSIFDKFAVLDNLTSLPKEISIEDYLLFINIDGNVSINAHDFYELIEVINNNSDNLFLDYLEEGALILKVKDKHTRAINNIYDYQVLLRK